MENENSDHVYGAVNLGPYGSPLQKMNRSELNEIMEEWFSSNGGPPEIISREQACSINGPELEHVDLSGEDLSDLDLRCLRLTSSSVQGANLSNSNLDGILWFGCDVSNISSWNASFRGASLRQCLILESTFMYGHFEDASFAHSNLECSKLIGSFHDENTWFFKTRIYKTDLSEARLNGTNLSEARTLFGIKLHGARLEGAQIDIDLFEGNIGEEIEKDYVKAAKAYLAIKANREAAGYYSQAARAYIKERLMEKRASAPWHARKSHGQSELGDKYKYSSELNKVIRTELGTRWRQPKTWWFYIRHTTKWIADWFVEILCGYGENLWLVLMWMFLMIFIIGPSLISLLGGVQLTGNNSSIYQSLSSPFRKLTYMYFQYLLYSIDTFTTANFADVKPSTEAVRLVSGIISMIGIFLTGLLGFVAGNRIRYS